MHFRAGFEHLVFVVDKRVEQGLETAYTIEHADDVVRNPSYNSMWNGIRASMDMFISGLEGSQGFPTVSSLKLVIRSMDASEEEDLF